MSDDETKPSDDAAPPQDAAPEPDTPPDTDTDTPSSSDDASSDDASSDDASPAEAEAKPTAKPSKREKPTWKPPPPERLEGAIEAILLVSGDVVRPERLRDILGLDSVIPLREAVTSIAARWDKAGLAFELEEVAGGVRVVTRPEYAEYVARLIKRPASDKLSRALLETLCIVAYKQPVARAEVERIRGVQAGDGLRQLLERRLLKVVGRSDQPGRPLLYGTTQMFLTAFGLKDLKDLPAPKDLQRL